MKLNCFNKILSLFILLVVVTFSTTVLAATFSAGISPPRFEFKAKPGQVIRDRVVILNASDQFSDFNFQTSDWKLDDNGGVTYNEGLISADSCRPWVKLERKTVRVRPGGQKKYRFEVHVPENAVSGLCKFAILIEPGEEKQTKVGENIQFPVVGRYAVIVYVTVGDTKSDIQFQGLTSVVENNMTLPAIRLVNKGNTLERLFGSVEATGPDGTQTTLTISDYPVLPEKEVTLSLHPDVRSQKDKMVDLKYPLMLKGRIETRQGDVIELNQIFSPG